MLLAVRHVNVPQFRRLANRAKPNLRLDNLKYHRPPTPTPEERLAAKKKAAKEARRGGGDDGASGGMGKAAREKASRELDDLFGD